MYDEASVEDYNMMQYTPIKFREAFFRFVCTALELHYADKRRLRRDLLLPIV